MFPVPVGGFVVSIDLAPSILFAILYALLFPLVIYRFYDRRSRSFLLLSTGVLCHDRFIMFTIRALQSHRINLALSNGILKYSQSSTGMGYVAMANDLASLTRCLLVNASFGPGRWDESPASITKESSFQRPKDEDEDRPIVRFWARRFADLSILLFLVAFVCGLIANTGFNKDDWDGKASLAKRTFNLRYASTAVALLLIAIVFLAANWSRWYQARACHKAINLVSGICLLVATIAIYRLSVMWHTSTSLDSTAPGTLTSPGAKATFYVLHVLPEWLGAVIILGSNTRKIFGAGPWGDTRFMDDSPEQRAKSKEQGMTGATKMLKDGEVDSAEV